MITKASKLKRVILYIDFTLIFLFEADGTRLGAFAGAEIAMNTFRGVHILLCGNIDIHGTAGCADTTIHAALQIAHDLLALDAK